MTEPQTGRFHPDYGPAYRQPVGGPESYMPPTPPFTFTQNPPPWQDPAYAQQQGAYGQMGNSASASARRGRKFPRPVLFGLVAALVIAIGAYALSGGSGGGTSNQGQLTTLWASGGNQGAKLSSFSGSWASANLVVDARMDGAIAYQLWNPATHKGGAERWWWQAPSGTAACEMSASTSNGIGVIAYGTADGGIKPLSCDHLVGLNVATGAVLWTIDLAPAAAGGNTMVRVSDPYISLGGDTLAAVGQNHILTDFDLATGEPRWHAPDTASCQPEGTAVSNQTVYELESCLSASSTGESVTLEAYSAEARSLPQAQQLPGTASVPTGAEPELWQGGNHLMLVEFSAASPSALLVYDTTDAAKAPVTVNLSGYSQAAFDSARDGQLNPRGWAVAGDTLYIQDRGPSENVSGVSALSLTTGAKLWDRTAGQTSATIVGAGAMGVEVVISTAGQSGYQLANLARADGTVAYGPSTKDSRFYIKEGNSTLYIEGDYFINIEDLAFGGTPGIVVLGGASHP